MASLFPPIEEVSSRPRVEHIPLGFYIPSLGCVYVRAPFFPMSSFLDLKTKRHSGIQLHPTSSEGCVRQHPIACWWMMT